MQTHLVMTVVGRDCTGLVESIARLVAEHEGNWLESRMCRLGGEFAGLLRVQVPRSRRAALESSLAQLTGLRIVVQADEAVPAAPAELATLEVVGPDRPGIVREITAVLTAQGVNVEELATECTSAPMSGEPLFQARAELRLPAGLSLPQLRAALTQPVGAMGLEFTLTPPAPGN
jgi:glycine cleavage system regulatory protein